MGDERELQPANRKLLLTAFYNNEALEETLREATRLLEEYSIHEQPCGCDFCKAKRVINAALAVVPQGAVAQPTSHEKLREALCEALDCIGENMDIPDIEWANRPLKEWYAEWRAALSLPCTLSTLAEIRLDEAKYCRQWVKEGLDQFSPSKQFDKHITELEVAVQSVQPLPASASRVTNEPQPLVPLDGGNWYYDHVRDYVMIDGRKYVPEEPRR